MRVRWRIRWFQALVLGLMVLAGCQGQPPALTQVRGKIWYKGMPLKGGIIAFTPDSNRGHRGDPAFAEVQPDGSFQLKTGDNFGAAPGWHRITISALGSGTTAIPGHPYTPLPQPLLPAKYCDPELSGLRCEVEANKPNSIDFQLE